MATLNRLRFIECPCPGRAPGTLQVRSRIPPGTGVRGLVQTSRNRCSAFRGDERRRVGRDHHLDAREPLIGQPLLAQRVRTRPAVIGGHISQGAKSSSTTIPPVSTRVDNRFDINLAGRAGVEEQRPERTPVPQGRPVGRQHVDEGVILEDLRPPPRPAGVPLRGQDSRRVAAHARTAARRCLRRNRYRTRRGATAGRRQRCQQPSGLVAAERDVAGPTADVERSGHDVGQLRRGAHGVLIRGPGCSCGESLIPFGSSRDVNVSPEDADAGAPCPRVVRCLTSCGASSYLSAAAARPNSKNCL